MKRKRSKNHNKHSYLHHVIPVIVWLATVAVICFLFYNRSQRFEVVGLAQARVYTIAATCTGRLQDVRVELFDYVQKDQVVAVIDPVPDNQDIQAQLNTVAAQIEFLQARLAPTQEQMAADAANLELTRKEELRRYNNDIENARLQILQLRVQHASDQITLKEYESEVKILTDLLNKEAIKPLVLEKAQALYNSMQAKMQENEKVLEQADMDYQQAEARKAEFLQGQLVHPSVDNALAVIQREITVQERIMDEIISAQKPVELRSPIDGIVVRSAQLIANTDTTGRNDAAIEITSIKREGEVVRPGDPILAVAVSKASQIVAYINESVLGRIQENMEVELIKVTEPAQIARSNIVQIGPAVEILPNRLWANPTIPQWGRPVLINVPPGFVIIPGEVVGVRGL